MNAAPKKVSSSDENVTKLDASPNAPAESAIPPPVSQAPVVAAARRKRTGGRYLLMAALPVALIAGGAYLWVTGGRYEATENANLRQAKISIASDTAGRVSKVLIADNALVKAGDPLFQIDPEPYKIALAQADAALAAARLTVEQYRAAYSQAVAQERMAGTEVDYLKTQLSRQTDLTGKGINTRSALDQAQHDLAKAQDEQKAAIQGVASALATLGGDAGIATDQHPTVLAARAARDKAEYDLAHTTVTAPSNGVVSQAASFKVGQFVGSGTALFSLVETDDVWVEANFKETQLTNMKVGQAADVVIDTYPGRIFHATLAAIGAGTGAEFSLLPAQNATGNWVKVEQRIPVRFTLDAGQVDVALRTGMSASVDVDTGVSRNFSSLLGTAHAQE